MTPRQCEIAAESSAASVLARSGYDVLVQYGPHQQHYDLVAVKGTRILLISVKGNQDGGWPLAVSDKKTGLTYHQAIDAWAARQRADAVFILVQFLNVPLLTGPRIYVVRRDEIVAYMKSQNHSAGHGTLWEDYPRDHPKSHYNHQIPAGWVYSQNRIDTI
jgi:Holliday junction resolvase-like predicted endonuclease